jgi:hypothetical protein
MLLAYCGLDCEKCDAYLATLNNDHELRVKTAKKWSKIYGADIKPEHINCVGCEQPGVHVYHCESLCEVRKCAKDRKYGTCAECATYPCANLQKIFSFSDEAKKNLDKLKNK